MTFSNILLNCLVIWSISCIRQHKFSELPCVFPDFTLGEYVTQSASSDDSQIHYLTVNISLYGITPWGTCLRSVSEGTLVIGNLSMYEDVIDCVRCISISRRSNNVLVVRSKKTNSGNLCYNLRTPVEEMCINSDSQNYNDIDEWVLYKTARDSQKEICPFSGRYTMHYQRHNKNELPIHCTSNALSQVNTCPVGSELKVHFRGCHEIDDHDVTYECLGSWSGGANNESYIALHDIRPRNRNGNWPEYRCGLFLETTDGKVIIGFSSDSTCKTNLYSSKEAEETLLLIPIQNTVLRSPKCEFLSWLQGEWDSSIVAGGKFTYTDRTLFQTYEFSCQEHDDNYARKISHDGEKFLVHGRSACGQLFYNCIWVKNRGWNVFEMKFGLNTSSTSDISLCSQTNFDDNMYIDQARKDIRSTYCPISGDFTGVFNENNPAVCVKLSSDCLSPDKMLFSIFNCKPELIFEKKHRRYSRSVNKTEATDELKESSLPFETTTIGLSRNQDQLITTIVKNFPENNLSEVETITDANESHSTVLSSISQSIPKITVSSTNIDHVETSSIKIGTTVTIPHTDFFSSTLPIPTIKNVQSYFIENANLSELLKYDADFNIPARTFLPPLASSSTSPPAPGIYNTYRREGDTLPSPTSSSQRPPQSPFKNTYSPPVVSNTKHQQSKDWDRRGPPPLQQQTGVTAGKFYYVDPNVLDRKRVIALPPVPLPSDGNFQGNYNKHSSMSSSHFSRGQQTPVRDTHNNFVKDQEYRCLSHWKDNGITYVFTERKNTGYVCFNALQVNDTTFIIQELGRHCTRSLSAPFLYLSGTKLSCNSVSTSIVPREIKSYMSTNSSPLLTTILPTQSVGNRATTTQYTNPALIRTTKKPKTQDIYRNNKIIPKNSAVHSTSVEFFIQVNAFFAIITRYIF